MYVYELTALLLADKMHVTSQPYDLIIDDNHQHLDSKLSFALQLKVCVSANIKILNLARNLSWRNSKFFPGALPRYHHFGFFNFFFFTLNCTIICINLCRKNKICIKRKIIPVITFFWMWRWNNVTLVTPRRQI